MSNVALLQWAFLAGIIITALTFLIGAPNPRISRVCNGEVSFFSQAYLDNTRGVNRGLPWSYKHDERWFCEKGGLVHAVPDYFRLPQNFAIFMGDAAVWTAVSIVFIKGYGLVRRPR